MTTFMGDEDFKAKVLSHIEETKKFQQKVSVALFGDDDSEIVGLAKRVKDAEAYIEKDKKLKWMGAGVIAFVTAVATHAKEFWHWLIS